MILRIKTDSKKEHAKIRFHKHAASLSALPLLGFPPAWLRGKSGWGSPASIHSMQTLGIANSRRCTFAAGKQCLGRGKRLFQCRHGSRHIYAEVK